MEEIHFNEQDLDNIKNICQALFDEDPLDPRSWNYKRNLVRPVIAWWRIILFLLVVISGVCCLCFVLMAFSVPSQYICLLCIISVLLILFICLKRILICMVRIYQRFAPASLRNKCRFEPSCSEYMILSLNKYGLWRGLAKGINRIKRCNSKDGGYDYP